VLDLLHHHPAFCTARRWPSVGGFAGLWLLSPSQCRPPSNKGLKPAGGQPPRSVVALGQVGWILPEKKKKSAGRSGRPFEAGPGARPNLPAHVVGVAPGVSRSNCAHESAPASLWVPVQLYPSGARRWESQLQRLEVQPRACPSLTKSGRRGSRNLPRSMTAIVPGVRPLNRANPNCSGK